jgi:urease accessory protein
MGQNRNLEKPPMSHAVRILSALSLAFAPGIALAHTGGATAAAGFTHGLVHPLGGIDHLVVMVAVGVFAAQLGGRTLWAVPASFVALMAVGGALGVTGVGLPFVEVAIALSVVALVAAVVLRVRMPSVAAAALVGAFAIFHGHAHGTEMPETASGLSYGLGFVVATAALHAIGIGLVSAVRRARPSSSPRTASR